MCAYANETDDSCFGDSGGPLFLKENNRFTQVGIVATGDPNCEKAYVDYPGLYMRVTALKEWITMNAPGTEDSNCD